VEQILGTPQRILLLQRLRTVRGEVAQVFDQPRFGEESRSDVLLERGVVNERAEVLVVGKARRRVMFVDPDDGQLQCAAGIKAGRPRIGTRRILRPYGRIEDLRPLCADEVELAQALSPGLPSVNNAM
jgi:hypothetical protein